MVRYAVTLLAVNVILDGSVENGCSAFSRLSRPRLSQLLHSTVQHSVLSQVDMISEVELQAHATRTGPILTIPKQ